MALPTYQPGNTAGNQTDPTKKKTSGLPVYTPAQTTAPKVEVKTPTPKVKQQGKLSKAVGDFFDRPENKGMSLEEQSKVKNQLPSAIIESLPFGIGQIFKQIHDEESAIIRGEQDYDTSGIKNVKGKDLANVAPRVVLESGKEIAKAPFRVGADVIDAVNGTEGKTKFKIPGLGEVTSAQARAAERVANGEDPIAVSLEEGSNAIFDVLFVSSMAAKPFQARTVTTKKASIPAAEYAKTPDAVQKMQPKSFRLYEAPKTGGELTPDFVQRMQAQGMEFGKKFDPKLPSYFQMKFNPKSGTFDGKVVQIKPSLFDSFRSRFKSDITKVPDGYLNTVTEKSVKGTDIETAAQKPVKETIKNGSIIETPVEAPKSPVAVRKALVTAEDELNTIRAKEGDFDQSEVIQQINDARDEFNAYNDQNKIEVLKIPGIQKQGVPLVSIDVVPYEDGFLASASASTNANGVAIGFDPGTVYKTKEEAVQAQKDYISQWLEKTRDSASTMAELKQFEMIQKALTSKDPNIVEKTTVQETVQDKGQDVTETETTEETVAENGKEEAPKPKTVAKDTTSPIQRKIDRIDAKLEEYRQRLEAMPSRKMRATININYDALLADRRRLEAQLEKASTPTEKPKTSLQKATEARINKILDKEIRTRKGKVMTKRQHYQEILDEGGELKVDMVSDTKLLNRLFKEAENTDIGRTYEIRKDYEQRLQEASEKRIPSYRLYDKNGMFTELSKYEYEAMKKEGMKPKEQAPKDVFSKKKVLGSKVEDYFAKRTPETEAFTDKIIPAKTPTEMAQRVEQLNKFAQQYAILRRTGGLSNKALGVFKPKGKRGDVRLQNSIISNPEEYMSVLAHELGHALEYNLFGATNVNTFGVFGRDLTAEEIGTIRDELKAVTNKMEGEAVAKAGAGYYYKPTELLARFLQRMFEAPGDLAELAPTAVEYFERAAIQNPIMADYLDAVHGNIDKGVAPFVFMRDMRQTYQKHLGNRVGDLVWKEEIAHRAMKERGKIVIEKFLKEKFKGIKDSPELLFNVAESIKVTEDGVPQFGTRDFAYAKTDQEVADLTQNGFRLVTNEAGEPVKYVDNGVEYNRYAKSRYTPEQGKAMYNQLSPEGQRLIREFTARKEEAKDYFNRELIKTVNKIESDVEGWVHHYFDDSSSTAIAKGQKFKNKVAAARKQRTGAEGFVRDFQAAMQKALTELETEKQWNDFIDRQFARVTKPIERGKEPDKGWVRVVGNLKKGVGTPQEAKTVVIKDGKAMVARQPEYQMPQAIYDRYKLLSEPAVEASKALRIMNSLNRYWRVNILFHPGSAATNFISGGVQYSTKILTDFYTEALTGNVTFPKTRRNLFSMVTVLHPKGWQNAPDWMYGGDLSNYYGQFGLQNTPGILDKGVDAYADKALKVYGLVERYWKKVLVTAERGGELKKLEQMSKEGLRMPTDLERQMLDEINKEVDLFAYDYDNVPMWLANYNSSPAWQAFKPFAKYPYKYSKHLSQMIGSIFDRTIPWQERMAKILAVGTIIAMYAYARQKRKERQTTPEVGEDSPASVSTRGRLFSGTDEEGNEKFIRVAKYPFINVSEMGALFAEGNSKQGFQSISDMLGGIAPAGQIALGILGFKNEFQQYTPAPVIVGDNLASFVPGTRILQDVARYFDPYQRKKTTFGESFTSLIPVPSGNEDLLRKLRGSERTIQVPLEGGITRQPGEGTKRTTTDMLVKNYKEDILLGLLSGIYTTRIDPDVAGAFVARDEENAIKEEKKKKKSQSIILE